MIEVLTELGRRLISDRASLIANHESPIANHESRIANHDGFAACNLARDMLARGALGAWLERYPGLPVARPRDVLVIMAGNVPFVGMHDLICVLAAGHRAIVKPSSRDRLNMEWVVAQLLDIDPRLPLSIFNFQFSINPHAVIAMGSDATVAAITARYPAIPTLLRGSRSSLAVLTGRESEDELEGLADDVLLYSGLGCRSVSLVWVPRGYDFGLLGEVLARREPTLPDPWRGSLRQTRALFKMTATPHIDTGAALFVETPDFPARPGVVNYISYDTPAQPAEWIAEHKDDIQCIATNFPFSIFNFPFPRPVRLGRTQRPGLGDYPDGRDTMRFLMEI